MKVEVDQELCVSCGACIDICPAVYDWNEDEKAETVVDEIPENEEADALTAMESCPTEAIREIEE